MERKSALLIAADTFDDQKFGRLRSPSRDVGEFARVLADPRIGRFDVSTLVNQESWVVSEAIEELFIDRSRDEVILIYFACHGMKDPTGRLYFVMKNTKSERLSSTGISSAWVNEQLDRSRCQKVLVLLDCCYSGAYAKGLSSRDDQTAQVVERFEGSGRAVITASDAMEYAYEGDELSLEAGRPSFFTRTLVNGLETGEADIDQDGFVSARELYNYLYREVRALTNYQTPTWSGHGLRGELYVARNPRLATVRSADVAEQLYAAVDSELAWERSGAVIGLTRMLTGESGPQVLAATRLLERLENDPDSAIRTAVRATLNLGSRSEGNIDGSNFFAQALDELHVSPPVPETMWQQATIQLEVVGVRVEMPSNNPIVLMKEISGDRYLPCWIGSVEASAVAFAQQKVLSAKPLTHELFARTLTDLAAVLERVIIAELRDGIFHTVIIVRTNAGRHTIESRLSDAIALALRLGGNVPILTTEAVMDQAGTAVDDETT